MAPDLRRAMALLFDRTHRGLLLDVVVLLVNLLAMPMLVRSFVSLVRRAGADDPGAMAVLFAGSVALFVLAPAGATLKRWHHHQRGGLVEITDGAGGCLFSPIFYFSLATLIFSVGNAFLLQRLSGGREPTGALFGTSLVLGIALIITHTVLVYRYFSPPQRPPRSAFMRGPASERLGDVCLFLNMMLFQVIWNTLSFAGLGPPDGPVEAVLRLLVLCFLALLLYFPPRMFYLAEDIGRTSTWLMILAANAPVITRMLLGSATT